MDQLEFLHFLADRADQMSLKGFDHLAKDEINLKADGSIVTYYDKAIEADLREAIEHYFPMDTICGEEYAAKEGTNRKWIIDPIDGTKYFASGQSSWGTLIALEEGGVVVAGLASSPVSATRWWATLGGGAFLNDRKCSVSAQDSLDQASLAFSRSNPIDSAADDAALGRLVESVQSVHKEEAFLRYLSVGTGSMDLGANSGPNAWDLAVPIIFVTEAGGRFSDLEGNPSIYSRNALATNGLLHDQALAVLSP